MSSQSSRVLLHKVVLIMSMAFFDAVLIGLLTSRNMTGLLVVTSRRNYGIVRDYIIKTPRKPRANQA
jgi:hypothetical protein